MGDLQIVFFGTSVFACRMLKVLHDEKYTIAAVVSQPDKPVGRKKTMEKTPVHALADEYGITCLQPERLKDAVDEVLACNPDLIVTCAYGQIVPQEILEAPAHGCLNVHPSLLPKYRGGAPMHYAVWNGDEKTGVCLMEMVKKMDAGKVYARCELPIGPDETMAELSARLEDAAAALLKENLPKYLAGELKGEPQDEEGVVIARNISREEEKVCFAQEDVHAAYNHVRAMIDWPVSHGVVEGKRIKFLGARKELGEAQQEPGVIVGFEKHAMKIACKGGWLLVQKLQMEGKKPMDADSFANGIGRTLIGKRFE